MQEEEEDDFDLIVDENGEIVPRPKEEKELEIAKEQSKELWVDKYTSHRFFDLLTDEVTNRNVLTWLKTWDEVVYPNKPLVNLKMPQSMQRQFNNSGFNYVHGG